jgi:fluoride ion exporter CrcB/FEX
MAFIVGVLVGNLFGMFLMGLLVASRERNDADRAYRKYKEGV